MANKHVTPVPYLVLLAAVIFGPSAILLERLASQWQLTSGRILCDSGSSLFYGAGICGLQALRPALDRGNIEGYHHFWLICLHISPATVL